MNDHGAHDLEESRTRRSVLATAGGLLLPAGLLIAGADDVEATKKAKRRRRRRHGGVGAFANDVIINFRNATNRPLRVRYNAWDRGTSRTIEPGTESGFVAGLEAGALGTKCYLYIRYPGEDEWIFEVTCENPEIGTPNVSIWGQKLLADDVGMGEDTTFDVFEGAHRLHVHRWSNGKEPLDGYDEWYTRFFVTMSNA